MIFYHWNLRRRLSSVSGVYKHALVLRGAGIIDDGRQPAHAAVVGMLETPRHGRTNHSVLRFGR
jgi:hypothetical protein